jgi:RNA polymerase sigma factor (TIGR02999 family)
MPSSQTRDLPLTDLLNKARQGDSAALEVVWKAVYGDLRKIARRASRGQDAAAWRTAATALVHDFFLRIHTGHPREWDSRAHFFGAAARSMEQLLVDRYRGANRLKRGGGQRRLALNDALDGTEQGVPADDGRLEAIVAATSKLADIAPRAADVTRLRFVLGLTTADIADVLDVSERTVRTDWTFAKAFLHRAISSHG